MTEYKVLITTSGLGSRLGNMTDFTNKSLVRVGKKPSISYAIESYPEEIEIVVTLGHFGNQVKDFIELSYPNRKFNFVWIDKYEGEGSSLAYSMSKASKELQCPFIFHACDTITTDKILEPTKNWLAGKFLDNSSQYRTLMLDGDKVRRINNKGEIDYDMAYMGIAGINDYKEFWEELFLALDSEVSTELSDCNMIQKMINSGHDFEGVKFDSWLDVGNVDSLRIARESIYDKFHLLDKLEESIFFIDGSVVKFFYDSTIIENRVKRAGILSEFVPEITGQRDNFYKYDYSPGDLYSRVIDENNIKHFLEWSKNIWSPLEKYDEYYQDCYNFYFNKTEKRLESFYKSTDLEDRELTINGLKCDKVSDLLSSIDPDYLCDGLPFRFHGDFIPDNIIKTEDSFVLIDWRHDFGGNVDSGDKYYDLAKFNHNLVVNHDIISRNLFNADLNGENVECDILCNYKMVLCKEAFDEFSLKEGFDLQKISILTSIIWLNMCALHEGPLGIFLHYFGQYHLQRSINNAKKEKANI